MSFDAPNYSYSSLTEPLLKKGDIEFAENTESSKNDPQNENSFEDPSDNQQVINENEDLVSIHEEDPEISFHDDIPENDFAYDHQHHMHSRVPEIVKSMCYMLLFVAAITSELAILYDDYKEHHQHRSVPQPLSPPTDLPPYIKRMDEMYACAVQLSGITLSQDQNEPQWRAFQWFLEGSGQFIPSPKKDQCSFHSSHVFVQLYALLVIRESLHLNEPTWGYDEMIPIRSLSDVCHKWHRITCNDHSTVITKLHLSDMSATALSGSIPKEIAALHSLERLELYSNVGLVGSLPHEMSQLSSLEYLYLQHTKIEGNIPSWLGSLSNLKELFLDDTNLVGSVPSSVCELRVKSGQDDHENVILTSSASLLLFHADCGGDDPRVLCKEPSCCTNCYDHK